ncbi:zinc transport system substrate-binding protein [Roseivivax lentus]|uniref:High-affinity zinc uptake system protein ZnuA n=1 Tax=Roseivivax lentus TaxID=633194 RepID=A0A1N7KW59_9RHOB|nr:zinc ABC transporter substrate-binding protein [Roseivivax lentus]SIS65843.1 zinc transport system substrate-binding protein [Roseivivax lentus]
MRKILTLCLGLGLSPVATAADPLRVVADIPPVAALAEMVLGADGQVVTLLPPGASPHDHALSPGDAGALQEADLVVWIGAALTPNLEKALGTLSGDALRLTLADLAGTHLLEPRETAIFAAGHDDHDDHDHAQDAKRDDHDHDAEHNDAHGHADDHDHDHAKDHAEAAHDDYAADAHGHGHSHDGPYDPHLWLAPENATLWLDAMAEAFTARNPEAAETYRANAATAKDAIAAASDRAAERLDGTDRPLAVLHDAFYYFEDAFGLTILGALTPSDAARPSPRRMAELRDALPPGTCLLVEPQYDPRIVDALGQDIAVAEIDMLGAFLPQDAALYPTLIEDIATRIAECG